MYLTGNNIYSNSSVKYFLQIRKHTRKHFLKTVVSHETNCFQFYLNESNLNKRKNLDLNISLLPTE